jgi:DNA polymerase-3 subunit delta
MAEIDYKSLKGALARTLAKQPAQIYLIHGEEMLVKEAFGAVLEHLLPEAKQSLNFERLDGAEADIAEVVERINTYSLMPGNKVVAFTDARLFLSGQDRGSLLKKAAGAVDADDLKAGARHLLSAMGLAGLTLDDLSGPARAESLKLLGLGEEDAGWLDRLTAYCREKRLAMPKDRDDDAVLRSAVERGIPKGNHLIVTTEQVDRRRRLYSFLKEQGTVIDCSVPKGERHADRQVQEAVMRRQMNAILDAAGKGIEDEAAARLLEMTGFDLRTAAANLEKLIDYVGDRPMIRDDDVRRVLHRTKKDPIFEFTNALTDRNLDGALFYLDSLLSGGVLAHPLQLLGAAANQLRKLILLKEFAQSPGGGHWQPQMNFNTFRNRVLPALQDCDARMLERLADWRRETAPPAGGQNDPPKKKKKGGAKGAGGAKTDLRMVANPRNAYPVYQLLKKSEGFSLQELTDGLREVARCDLRIKTGGGDPRLILEKAVIAVCAGPGARSPRKHTGSPD